MFFNTAGTPPTFKKGTTYRCIYVHTEYLAVTAEANKYTSENAGYLAVYMYKRTCCLGILWKCLDTEDTQSKPTLKYYTFVKVKYERRILHKRLHGVRCNIHVQLVLESARMTGTWSMASVTVKERPLERQTVNQTKEISKASDAIGLGDNEHSASVVSTHLGECTASSSITLTQVRE